MKGENAYDFPFHYGQEAESYTFYRVPKILFTAEAFDHLSTDAKLLYACFSACFWRPARSLSTIRGRTSWMR